MYTSKVGSYRKVTVVPIQRRSVEDPDPVFYPSESEVGKVDEKGQDR